MNHDAERRKLEELLREALHAEAARIQPAGEGLDRIRQRVAARRRMLSWLRPSLGVLATVCAVAATVTTLLLYLRSGDSQPVESGRQALSAHPARTASGVPTATELPAPGLADVTPVSPDVSTRSQPPTPIDGDPGLPDMTTVWPYGSRGEGLRKADRDVRSRVHPDLVDPRQTAVRFIESFVGTADKLIPDDGVRLEAGIGVTVSRLTGDGALQPVSRVYLVRVRKADDSPYVVVNASRPGSQGQPTMTVDPGTLQGTSELRVGGTFLVGSMPAKTASVKVELREPGGDEVLASDSPSFSPDPDVPEQQDWTATLTPIRKLRTPTGTVAAWTVDVQNHLLAFVAEPTDSG